MTQSATIAQAAPQYALVNVAQSAPAAQTQATEADLQAALSVLKGLGQLSTQAQTQAAKAPQNEPRVQAGKTECDCEKLERDINSLRSSIQMMNSSLSELAVVIRDHKTALEAHELRIQALEQKKK